MSPLDPFGVATEDAPPSPLSSLSAVVDILHVVRAADMTTWSPSELAYAGEMAIEIGRLAGEIHLAAAYEQRRVAIASIEANAPARRRHQ
jgi:hypothetical protein